ncbi:ZN692 protein, partial [Urocolius indicus]|nr:ZN692 protein [Urocolius indicus]
EASLLHTSLQHLVVLSHGHGQECGFIPAMKPPAPGGDSQLVWECVAGHSFSWGVPKEVGGCHPTTPHQHNHPLEGQREGLSCGVPGTGRRRSLRRLGLVAQSRSRLEGAAGSGGDGDQREEARAAGDGDGDGGGDDDDDGNAEGRVEPQGDEEEEEEGFAEDYDLAYTDDPRDENYQPSLDSDSEPQRRPNQTKTRQRPIKEEQPQDELSLTSSSPPEEKSGQLSCKRRRRPLDDDVAQIGPKRIRKAAKREILLCDFEGCGKIFSNRQYLNHHKKYQHVHQKTFTCSEPSCGKSFNFKKHLKEHEKLHSDKRDYICEFCARSFRTSSNLIIHRRIHTGEKPLQ